jgi:predicted acylesterase/phospholipase RssA
MRRIAIACAIATTVIFSPTVTLSQGRPPTPLPAGSGVTPKLPHPASMRGALTIEGGGTLGTYEGGLSWALVEIFRRHRLLGLDSPPKEFVAQPATDSVIRSLRAFNFLAVAGASAGSINAFLAANRWCSTGPIVTAQESPFWKVWVSTGLRDMMPRRDTARGVFSRTSYGQIFDSLDAGLRKSHYDPVCSVAFGAAITRLTKDSVAISSGRNVFARNQRYAAAFDVRPPEVFGKPPYYARLSRERHSRIRMGQLVDLPLEGADDSTQRRLAHDLIEASSGFPLVFEPYRVSFCREPHPRETAYSTLHCRIGLVRDSAFFVDGGVFDNGPLTIAYGIALADTAKFSIDSLAMIFVTPSPRRETSGTNQRIDRRSAGLDAVARLISTFVPSSRQYELQIAGRFLPTIQIADAKGDTSSQRITDLEAQRDSVAAQQYRALAEVWRNARSDVASLWLINDSLQGLLAKCRQFQPECWESLASASSRSSAELDSRWLGSPPQQVQVESVTGRLPFRQPFDSLLFVTDRWHDLAGDWLFGFGAFIGRPFREQDFYVGVYDALALIARRIRCDNVSDSSCVRDSLADLIERPPLVLNESEKRILGSLYNREYRQTAHALPDWRTAPDNSAPPSEQLIGTIIEAMSPEAGRPSLSDHACNKGGPIEKLACNDGLLDVFDRLMHTPRFRQLMEMREAYCDMGKHLDASCEVDRPFVTFVEEPTVALNNLVGEALERIWSATPRGSGLKKPLTMITAAYYSTNERARSRFDAGSVSLPTMTRRQTIGLSIIPSSVGGFMGMRGWYVEWAGRFHVNEDWAPGVAGRVVWSSRVRTPPPQNYGNHFVPGFRLDRKMGLPYSPWVSTLGLDVAYWADGFSTWDGAGRLSPGFTAALFAQRVRVLLGLRPRPTKRTQFFWSIGAGDVPGFIYWLAQFATNES